MKNPLKKVDLHLFLLLVILIGFYLMFIQSTPNHLTSIRILKKDTINLTTFSEKNLNSLMCLLEVEHPEVVIAQAKLETGNYTSKVFKESNNLFGFMKGKSYYKYKDWKQSVLHYAHWQNMNYKGGDYYTFLKNIKYATDTNYILKLKKICIK